LRQTPHLAPQKILLMGNVQLASRVRVLLGKDWTVVQTDRLNPAALADYKCLLIPDGELFRFVGSPWKIQTAGAILVAPPPRELWAALKAWQLQETLARSSRKLCLVTRQ
jgi:hypothetical protein